MITFWQMLMMQKSACDAMIYEKNKLINDFQTVSVYGSASFHSKKYV